MEVVASYASLVHQPVVLETLRHPVCAVLGINFRMITSLANQVSQPLPWMALETATEIMLCPLPPFTFLSAVGNWFAFATSSGLQWFSTDAPRQLTVEPAILPSPTGVLSLDVDIENDTIYWIDSSLKGIYRAPMEGGTRESIVTKGLINPTALAVDWMGKNLYWADSGTMRIEVSRLNGTQRRVLLEARSVVEVTALAVDLKSQWEQSYINFIIHLLYVKMTLYYPMQEFIKHILNCSILISFTYKVNS